MPLCDGRAEWIAETPFDEVPLCNECYESMIASAEKNNPDYAPGVVRSCMERASRPIRADAIAGEP